MNSRVLLSKPCTVESLTTTLRIVAAVVLVAGGYIGYRVYGSTVKLNDLRRSIHTSSTSFQDAQKLYRDNTIKAAGMSRVDVTQQTAIRFAAQLDRLCRESGGKITKIATEGVERMALDNFDKGTAVPGWQVVGSEVDVVGSYPAIHAILNHLSELPSPVEVTGISITRLGLMDNNKGSKLELKMNVEVYQPGGDTGAAK